MEKTDAVVIGAGPVGLFQVFQLGLQGLACHVIDALPQAGGQCAELYGDKPIYDIPAVPVCTGQELTDRLLETRYPRWLRSESYSVDAKLRQIQALADRVVAEIGSNAPKDSSLSDLKLLMGSVTALMMLYSSDRSRPCRRSPSSSA